MSRHDSKEEKETIITYYNQGYGCIIISSSQRLGISERQVSRVINQYHELGDCCLVKRPYQYYRNEFKVDIVKHVLEKCLSCEQVALRYGVGISTLELWVRKVKQDGYDSLIADHPRG